MISKLREAANDAVNIPRFTFKGRVCYGIAVSVYDGDTCDVVLHIEGDMIGRFRVRLLGYNSPEMKMSLNAPNVEREENHVKAVQAKDTLYKLLGVDDKALLRLECGDWDKYGRILCKVYKLKDGSEDINEVAYCVNDKMLDLTASVPYMC